ncbi:MAG TPA: phospholipid carrier-dependent glycosyltransferase [Candidatus Binatia bacterium]|nr:phospholipid carrier-dependent glycosyltransferase [Candidatus Binatia bacterium]
MSFWLSVLEGVALQAIIVGLAAVAAYRAGCAVLPASADLLERLCVTLVVAVTGWVALLQILGLLGILWLPVVVASLVVLAAVSLVVLPPAAPSKSGWLSTGWSAAALAVPFAVLAVVVTLSGPPGSNSYDSVHYQIVNAAHVLDTGSIRSLPFAQPGESTGAAPGNGSLLLLAVMLPFHAAGLAGLVDLLSAVAIVGMAGIFSRELERPAWMGLLAGLIVVTTVGFFETQFRSAYDDSPALLGLVAGAALGLRWARTDQRRWLFLAGVCLGLTAGAKAAFLLPTLVAAGGVLWAGRGWRRPGSVALLLAAILSLSLAWYVRNWALTGNPLFPEPVRIGSTIVFPGLSGPSSASAGVEQTLLDSLLGRGGIPLSTWAQLAVLNFGLAVAAPLASLVLIGRARGAARPIVAVAVGCVLVYAVMPFSGSVETVQANASLRFLLPAIAFGVVALTAVLPARSVLPLAAVTLGVGLVPLLVVESHNGFVNAPILGAAAAVTAATLAALRWRSALSPMARRHWFRPLASSVLAVSAVLLIAHLQPATDLSPAGKALSAAAASHQAVVVMDVGDVAAILGPTLEGDVVAAGQGPVGAERPIRDPEGLSARITSLHPALVVIGDVGHFDVLPASWTPPPSWRRLGDEDGAAVYSPLATDRQ